jgi:hypothetical protein
MKTWCLSSYLWSRGEQRPTPPCGRPQGRHVTRRGDILHDAISGSGPPRESTGPLYTQPRPSSTVRDSQVNKPDPLGGDRTPLSEVQTTYSKVPGQGIPWPMTRTGKGPVLTRVQATTCALPLPAQAEARCHTRISGHQDPGANIITRCARTKSHTYDESWHRIECHIFTI